MAMLAEPRRKQKWSLNPRGKHWSEDSNKFGQKMLEKMGWTSGKGLGANMDGMTEHIRARYKNDQAGVGFSNEDKEKEWTRHQDGFNELLKKLQNGETAESSPKDNELSGKSLELKSKRSRARVHYQKFTRGKDVNKYSTKDLANIFGKRDLNVNPEVAGVEAKRESEESSLDRAGTSDASHGVTTIKGGSITDYFKNKLSSLGRKNVNYAPRIADNEPESDGERYAGFGFAKTRTNTENTAANDDDDDDHAFVNAALDIDSPHERTASSGKRKCDFVFENSALEQAELAIKRTPKRQRTGDCAFVNAGLDLAESREQARSVETKKSKIFEQPPKIEEGEADADADDEKEKKKSSINCEIVESLGRKKRKRKSREIRTISNQGFTNEALNLEIRDDASPRIERYEISRSHCGLANEALDLSDESSGKKRVTFNETIEYEAKRPGGATRKSAKIAGKLDKFEINGEKLKKKKKRREEISSSLGNLANVGGFVNEAMDIETMCQEANENAANERKAERARRKRERRNAVLSTIAEAPDEDNEEFAVFPEIVTLDDGLVGKTSGDLEILSLGTPRPRKKRSFKNRSERNEVSEEKSTREERKIAGVAEIDVNESAAESPSARTSDCEKSKNQTIGEEVEIIQSVVSANIEETRKKNRKRKKESINLETAANEAANECERRAGLGNEEKTMSGEKMRRGTDRENVEGIAEIAESRESPKRRDKRTRNELANEETGEQKCDSWSENLPENRARSRDKCTEIVANDEAANPRSAMENNSSGTWNGGDKRTKTVFRGLFARIPVLNFAGSNINEIKGYGMDFN